MKTRKALHSAFILAVTGCFLLPACTDREQKATPTVNTYEKDTTVYLQEGQKSPSCEIRLKYAYLEPASAEDSVSIRINKEIQQALFGPERSGIAPEAFADGLIEEYIRNYKDDVKGLFEADLHNGMKAEDIPAWYNYQYELTGEMTKGLGDSIWNYSLTTFQYTGGAHPNTFMKCLNLDGKTGRILSADDVFTPNAQKGICPLLEEEIIRVVNSRLEDDTLSSRAGLRERGILLDENLYIPENFLLEKDGILFYYNRYEIAPYAVGDFPLHIPYNKLQKYLKK